MQNDFYIRFDNFDLNTIPYVFITKRDPNEMPNIETITVPVIRGEGEVMVSRNYRERNINVEGFIIAPTRVAYEQAVDQLKYQLGGIERPLVLQQSGSDRRYTATVKNISIAHIEGGRASIAIEFRCSYPFGRSTEEVSYIKTFSTSPYSFSDLIYEGTAPAQPRIQLKINSGTSMTSKTITIGNGLTTQSIGVTRTWIADDTLVVDMYTRSVTVNGSPIDYDGAFSMFEPTSFSTLYADNFSARNVTATITYTKNYR